MPPKKAKAQAKVAPKKPAEKKKVGKEEKPSGPAATALYIKNFKLDGKDYSDIRAFFQNYGTLQQLRIKRSKKAKHGPYILAFYKTADSARKCVEQCKTVDGQRVSVEYANKAKLRLERSARCSTVFVEPVDKSAKIADIRKEFTLGSVKPIKIRKYALGHILVYYNKVEEATQAFAKFDGKDLFGKKVTLKYSVRTKERDAKKFVAPLAVFKEMREARRKKVEENLTPLQKEKLAKKQAELEAKNAAAKAAAPASKKSKASQKAKKENP